MIEPLGESQHSAKSLSLLRAKTAIGFDMSGAQIWSSRCILVELILGGCNQCNSRISLLVIDTQSSYCKAQLKQRDPLLQTTGWGQSFCKSCVEGPSVDHCTPRLSSLQATRIDYQRKTEINSTSDHHH